MPTMRRRVVALGALAALLSGSLAVMAHESTQQHDSLSPREQIAAQHTKPGHTLVRLASKSFDPTEGVPEVAASLKAATNSRYWLVQVEYPATKATRLAIEATGAEILSAMPDVTYVVRATAAQASSIRNIEPVRWVGAYEPAYKLAPGIEKLTGPKTLLVWSHKGVDARTIAPALAKINGVTMGKTSERVVEVSAGKAALAAIARVDDVEWVERKPEYALHNANALWVTNTGERDNLGAALPGRLDGKGQTAAVADTGINYIPDDNGRAQKAFSDCNAAGVCKLASYVQATPGFSPAQLATVTPTGSNHRKMAGYFNLDEDDPNARSLDPSWHGTHVSGSVAGDYPEDDGTYGTRNREADGIAVGARLVFQDIEAEGGLGGLPDDPYDLFNQVYDLNKNGQYDPLEDARTHNNSYGAIYPEADAMGGGARTDDFVRDHPDMMIVFSASNDGPDPASLAGGPQESKNVLTSCASANGRQPLVSPDAVAIFSSHGPTLDNRLKPDVCTPGQINVSPKGGTVDDDQYLQGTSMSGPMLVGLVTLVRQYYWDGFGPDGIQGFARGTRNLSSRHNPSAALVKATTINSAQRMRGWYSGDAGGEREQDGMWPSNGQGWGKVELDKSLFFEGDDRAMFTVDRPNDDTNGIETDTEVTEFIDVAPGQPFDITLAWTDPSNGVITGTPALVNDLDLEVTAPDGSVYVGNEFTTQTPLMGPGGDAAADVNESVEGGLPDSVNNVEGVRLATPAAGRYQVKVIGSNVMEGPQGYSLVASGRIATDQPRIVFDAPKYKPGAKATAYLLGTGLSGDTIGGFSKVAASVYSQEVTASGSTVSVSGGGVSASRPVETSGPVVSNVLVDSVAADLARVTWTTDEPSTSEIVVTGAAGEAVFPDVYNVAGFPGLTTPQAETKGNYLNKKVLSTKHEVIVTNLKPGAKYSYLFRSTDEAGNQASSGSAEFTSTDAMFSPNAPDIAMLLSGDTTTGVPGANDVQGQQWGTSTQLYAGSFQPTPAVLAPELDLTPLGRVDAMPAFMFRLPTTLDPSRITGAAVELFSGHDIVDTYTDHTIYSLDLLDSGAESGWGPGATAQASKKYVEVNMAAADVKLAPDPTLRRGGNKAYTWQVPCNDIEKFRTNLAEDTGADRRAAFRLKGTTDLPESLFSFETGYGRRSRGPQLRPRLILFMDGVDPMPCTATTAPKISNVLVDHVDQTSAVVSWRTDVPSDSTVYFRKVGSTEWIPVSAPVRVTQHFVRIVGLEANGPYEFTVRSATCNGLVSTDTNGGKSYALFNEAFIPAVQGAIYARPSPTENTTELVGWGSDQETTSIVSYGTSPNALNTQVTDETFTDTHELDPSDLEPCTRYYFQVAGKNRAGKVSTSPVMAFDRPPADLTELVSFDFEADDEGFLNDPADGSGTGTDPAFGMPIFENPTLWKRRADPAMGSFAMRTEVEGTGTPGYSSNADQRLVSPPIAIPAGYSVLRFDEWYELEGVQDVDSYEQPLVELSLDDGATWVRLREGIVSQNPDFPAPTTVQLGLPAAAAGKNIRVAFRLRSDPAVEPPGGGWAVDNVTILNGNCGSVAMADPAPPVAPDTPAQQLSSQAVRAVVGPIAPVDGSGNSVGVLAAPPGTPSKASLDAGTCRCTDITYLGLTVTPADLGGGGGGPAVADTNAGRAGPLPATGSDGLLDALLAAALLALAIGLRRRFLRAM
jgi:hypothetical protein